MRTSDEMRADKIEQLLHDSILDIVKKRQEVKRGEADSYGSNFLGTLLKNQILSAAEIIDECKSFYMAGQEATYSLLSWSIFLLAIRTDWPDRARKEALGGIWWTESKLRRPCKAKDSKKTTTTYKLCDLVHVESSLYDGNGYEAIAYTAL